MDHPFLISCVPIFSLSLPDIYQLLKGCIFRYGSLINSNLWHAIFTPQIPLPLSLANAEAPPHCCQGPQHKQFAFSASIFSPSAPTVPWQKCVGRVSNREGAAVKLTWKKDLQVFMEGDLFCFSVKLCLRKVFRTHLMFGLFYSL